MRKKKTQKKKFYIGDIFRAIGLIIALSVLLYPTISNYLYEKNGAKVISNYDENAVHLSESEKQAMLEAARQYNQELLGNIELLDPFSPVKKEVDERYQSLLSTNEAGMMGYIRIPQIDVELPIYHGTEEKVLQSGVGHFEGTSLPVGRDIAGFRLSCCSPIWMSWRRATSFTLRSLGRRLHTRSTRSLQ